MTLLQAAVVVLAVAVPPSEAEVPNRALISATEAADMAKIRSQLEAGADPDARNAQKQTPLMIAARQGTTEAASLLLAAGAEVNAKDQRGLSALAYAAGLGRFPLAQMLLANGADVNAKSKDGATALMLASQNGHVDTVAALLRSGAKVKSRGGGGVTALLLAIGSGHEAVAALLLEHGADTDAANSVEDRPLIVAARTGQAETVRALLEHDAEVNAKNWNGDTPLIEAVRYRRLGIVPALLDAGAKVESKNHNADTALGLARKFHDDRMVELLESGVDPAAPEEMPSPTPTITFGRRVLIPDMGPRWDCVEAKKIAPPEKTHDVPPDYPDVLKRRRQQGTVILEAKVNAEGCVTDISVAGTPSLLDAAAVDAVRQWRYAPTLLCGTPVPVIMTVAVSFTDELLREDKRINRAFDRY